MFRIIVLPEEIKGDAPVPARAIVCNRATVLVTEDTDDGGGMISSRIGLMSFGPHDDGDAALVELMCSDWVAFAMVLRSREGLDPKVRAVADLAVKVSQAVAGAGPEAIAEARAAFTAALGLAPQERASSGGMN